MEPYEKLQRFWRSNDCAPAVAAPRFLAVTQLEVRYRITLPGDFREYLIHACPTTDLDYFCDPLLYSWWGFDRVRSITEEYEHSVSDPAIAASAKQTFFFADYAIWSWAWAIACGDDENHGRVALISGQDRFVADSFAEFVDRFIVDPDDLGP